MYSQVVVEVLGYEIVDVGPDGGADLGVEHSVLVGLLPLPHIVGAELGLGLAFEVGLLYLYADGPDYALAAVGRLVVLLEEVFEGLGYGLPEGREMGASVAGVLPVDEGGDVLAVGIAVADDHLYVLAFEMDGRVQRRFRKIVVDKVEESVLRPEAAAVEGERETFLQIGVVLHHGLRVLVLEGVFSEYQAVGHEADQRPVLLVSALLAALAQLSALEPRPGAFPVPVGAYVEFGGQGVHGLGTDPVEAD